MPSPPTMFHRRSSAPNSTFSAAMRMSASLRGVLEVPTGAEAALAGAGDDKDEGIVVIAEALPGVVQLRIHRAVDRIVLMGTVVSERHPRPAANAYPLTAAITGLKMSA